MKCKYLLVLFFSIVLISITVFPADCHACKCSDSSVEEQLQQSDAVFTGNVLKIETGDPRRGLENMVYFEVNKTWKGVNETQIAIGSTLSDCSFVSFEKGKEYLVFASVQNFTGKEYLAANLCGSSGEISEVEDELSLLGDGKAPTERVNLVSGFSNEWIIWFSGIAFISFLSFFIWKVRKR